MRCKFCNLSFCRKPHGVMRYTRVKLTSTAALRQRDYINEREPFLWRIIHDLKAPLLIAS